MGVLNMEEFFTKKGKFVQLYLNKDEEGMIKMIDDNEIHHNAILSISLDTPLIYACRGEFKNLLNKLMNIEDINYNHVNLEGHAALYWACRSGMKDIVKKLLAKPNIKCNTGTLTPLHQACINKRIGIALMLLDIPNIRFDIKEDIGQRTAWDFAINNKMNSVIKKMAMIRAKNIDICI